MVPNILSPTGAGFSIRGVAYMPIEAKKLEYFHSLYATFDSVKQARRT